MARIQQEQELAINPAFFYALPDRMETVTGAEVWLRRGKGSNEMTRFRYDAVLEIRGSRPGSAQILWDDWKQKKGKLDEKEELPVLGAQEGAGRRGVTGGRPAGDRRLRPSPARGDRRHPGEGDRGPHRLRDPHDDPRPRPARRHADRV